MEYVLGKRMIDEGLVTPEQLEKALNTQKSKGDDDSVRPLWPSV